MARNVSGVYSLPATISNGDDGDATDLMAILNDMETDHNDVFALAYDNTATGDNTFSGTLTVSGTLDVTGTFNVGDVSVDYSAYENGLSRIGTDNGFAGLLIRCGNIYDTNDTRDEYTANEAAITMQFDYEAATPTVNFHFAPTGTTDGAITYDAYAYLNRAGDFAISPVGVERLDYDAPTEEFVRGDTITGGTSLATAVVRSMANSTLLVDTVSGTFQDNEIITGAIEGSATTNIPGGLVAGEYEVLNESSFFDMVDSLPEETDPSDTDFTILTNGKKISIVDLIYPVNSLYMSTASANPSTLFAGTTWVEYGSGRAVVGVGSNGESTWTGGQTQGSETHTLTEAQLPAHDHGAGTLTAASAGNHNHSVYFADQAGGGGTKNEVSTSPGDGSRNTSTEGAHTHTVSGSTANAGSGSAHNNIQPSIGVYIWRRTA